MANNSHVPKFGNWENDNVPYTAFFENARKQKTGVKTNPNDPEQNPGAFIRGGGTVAVSDHPYATVVAQSPPNYNSANKEIKLVQHADQGQRTRHQPHRSNNINSTTGGHNKSITSESNSTDEKSSSDYSLSQHRHTRCRKKKSTSHLAPQPSSTDNRFARGHGRQTSSGSTNHSSSSPSSVTDPHHRATLSIPKFGAWNEADPGSGEGFTAIFEKVKQEKQIASTNFPTTTVPQQPCNYMNGTQTKRRTSSTSKMCCCLFSSRSE